MDIENHSKHPIVIPCDKSTIGQLHLVPGITRDVPAEHWKSAELDKKGRPRPLVAAYVAKGSLGGITLRGLGA